MLYVIGAVFSCCDWQTAGGSFHISGENECV